MDMDHKWDLKVPILGLLRGIFRPEIDSIDGWTPEMTLFWTLLGSHFGALLDHNPCAWGQTLIWIWTI